MTLSGDGDSPREGGSPTSDETLSRNGAGQWTSGETMSEPDKRALARIKARQMRAGQKKKDRVRKSVVGGLAGLVVAAGVFALILSLTQQAPPRSGPANMLSDGITIGAGLVAAQTPGLEPDGEPVATELAEGSDVIQVRLYVDYHCAECKTFIDTNAEQMAQWMESGGATVEVHPIALQDRISVGSKYSSRAANAAACVANFSPDTFYAVNTALFADQPKEGDDGLSDDELVELVEKAGVVSPASIDSCIRDQTYKSWVNAATSRAVAGPIPNSGMERVAKTPTIIINGMQYTGPLDDAAAFAKFASTVAGNAYADVQATPTPEPEEPAAEEPVAEEPAAEEPPVAEEPVAE